MPSRPRTPRPPTRPIDAISLLTQDHRKVKRLLAALDATTERATNRRETLLKKIENEITVHSKIEEEIFYPAYKDAVRKSDEHIYYEALEEHHLVDVVIPEMKAESAESEEFGAKAKVLRDLVEHHAEEEESEMFPKARKAIGKEELLEIGKQIQIRKEQLQSGLLTRAARTAGSALDAVMSRVGTNSRKKRAA
jgi:hemerythrin-like domain-containing protein